MRKVIVTTTINPPTEAVIKFDAMPDWHLVVVGDRRTPPDYKLARGTYVTPADQEKLDRQLSDAIGWNSIQRRNFGFLVAYEMGADIVATIDDDNIPDENWGRNVAVGRDLDVDFFYETDDPVFDPIGATNYSQLWHRGYPLQLISSRKYAKPRRQTMHVDVQADFWNGDPDIDAICRMEHRPECIFDPACFSIASNKMSPFNSQNTFLHGGVLANYFVLPHVGRMDDIWASYYAQAKGYGVVYAKASVYQQRNAHDFTRDMRQEYIGYENNMQLAIDVANDAEAIKAYLPGRTIWAWDLYRRHFPKK